MQRDISLVIFTDLDGTLLDHDTYEFNRAEQGLDAVAQARVPLIMGSSKTRAEIEWLQRHLGMTHPFISENGGALFVPDGYFPFPIAAAARLGPYHVMEFGSRYPDLVQGLRRVAAKQNVRVLGFDEMTVDEIARTCGLSVTEARLAKRREYDEPFRVISGGAPGRVRLINALRREGFRCTRGARFDHLTGLTDTGVAVTRLRALFEREAASRARHEQLREWLAEHGKEF